MLLRRLEVDYMIDMNQMIAVKWGNKTKKHYIGLGYDFTDIGDTFYVPLKDTQPGFSGDVAVVCDCCGKQRTTRYKRYLSSINKYGNYYCINCQKKRSIEDRRNEHYDRILSFCDQHNYCLLSEKEDIENVESVIKYECPIHGIQNVKVKSVLAGKQCYKCSRHLALEKRWSHDKDERILELYNRAKDMCFSKGYELLTSIEGFENGWDSRIEYECPKHGKHDMSLCNFLSNKSCPDCAMEQRKKILPVSKAKENKNNGRLSVEDIQNRVQSCGGTILNPLDYVNNRTKNLDITCPRCGKVFTTSFVNFTQHGGQLCSDCYRKESIGEMKIRKYLELHNIDFYPEHWFPDCRDEKPLPFDFYLYNNNIAIEFDGEQHFEDTHYFNYSIEKNRLHDEIKTDYCRKNDIKLIRIPYWDLNKIDKILDKELFT